MRTSRVTPIIALLVCTAIAQVASAAMQLNPSTDLGRLFNVSAISVERLHFVEGAEGTWTVTLPLSGADHVVTLAPHSVRAEGYQLLIQQPDGSLNKIEPGPINTYRGSISGLPGSAVAAGLEEDGWFLRVVVSDHEAYTIEPLRSRAADAAGNTYVVYRDDDVIQHEGRCGTHEGLRIDVGNDVDGPPAGAGGACGTGLCVTELACDADFEYFQDYGSESAVQNRINTIINTVNVQYERDVQITHVITAIVVRTSEPDPYSSTDAVTLLNQFRDHWNANMGGIQRDTAQLFTGKEIDSSTIGIAWLNAICTSFGYSVVQSDFNNNFSCATDLSAHELGHNWGADHCSCTSNTMNPFITCANIFHPTFSIPEISTFRDSRTCLDGGNGCTSDTECDDGAFCNGAEVCVNGNCQAGGDPCPGQDCDEVNDICVPLVCNNDGTCDAGEDCNNCPNDCIGGSGASCGNGVCEAGAGEDCLSCPQDCNGRQNGKPSRRFCCGDGDGENPVDCSDSRCTSGDYDCDPGAGSPFCCGDGSCDGDEDGFNCEIDCGPPPACGDGNCDPGEDECSCPTDCGTPPSTEINCSDGIDEDCDGLTDCDDSDCSNDPSCACGAKNDACSSNADCCSNKCRRNRCR